MRLLAGPILVLACTGAAADCTVTPAFADPTLADWQTREFSGMTDYMLVREGAATVLDARTEGAASILYRERRIDLTDTPRLSWSWRIDGVYDGIDEQTRDGDDFPARLYVVVKTGFLPWETLAINYVWASHTPIGPGWPSPFTDKAWMIPVRSGADETGEWVCQSRDISADFKEAFGVRIDQIDGYAVMVDGDNSGRTGSARFGEIVFTR